MRRDRVPELLQEKWATIAETADILAVTRKTVHELINAKKLKTQKYFGNRTLISRESIKETLKQYA
jgi:excisionase family DNA binding protein